MFECHVNVTFDVKRFNFMKFYKLYSINKQLEYKQVSKLLQMNLLYEELRLFYGFDHTSCTVA